MPFTVSRRYRSENDDSAPVDYTYVGSVAEGEHRRQGEPIHGAPGTGGAKQPPAEPGAPRGYEAARRDPRQNAGPQSAASVAYPRPRDNAFARTPTFAPRAPQGLRDAQAAQQVRETRPTPPQPPFAPAAQVPQRAVPLDDRSKRPPQTPSAQAQPAPDGGMAPQASAGPEHTFTYQGSQYAAPPAQTVPDWLKAAQQNRTPYYVNNRPPRVEPAPPQAGEPRPAPPRSRAEQYAAAGYPPELVQSQRSAEESAALAGGYGHRGHGAQYAAPPRPSPAYDRQAAYGWNTPPASYPPPREGYAPQQPPAPGPSPRNPFLNAAPEEAAPYAVTVETPERRDRGDGDEEAPEEAEEKKKIRIPFLGISVFLAAMLVIALILMRLSYTAQTENVLAARAETIQSQLDNHPFAYRELIEAQAAANNLHPAFVAAIIYNESSFNPNAESNVGARGLMQMMPDTAEWVHGKIDADTPYSFDLMYDPETNVKYACWYLAYLSGNFYGDPVLVSAAFHGGQTTVRNWLNDSNYSTDHQTVDLSKLEDGPTKNYAIRVVNSYAIYRRLYYEGGADAAQAAATVNAR